MADTGILARDCPWRKCIYSDAARFKSDTRPLVQGLWFPIHSAKNAEWMGHGAFAVDSILVG